MRQFITRFAKDESGSVLILTALLMALLIALAGASYDLGRQQLIQEHTQQAMDAAVISGAVETQDEALRLAGAVYSLNYPEDFMGQPPPAAQASLANGFNVTLTADYQTPVSFTAQVGTTERTVTTTTSAPLKTVLNPTDLILVNDNTDSMSGINAGGNPVLAGNFDACPSGTCTCYPSSSPSPPTVNDGIMCGDKGEMKGACDTAIPGDIHCTVPTTSANKWLKAEATSNTSRLNALRHSANLLSYTLLKDNTENHDLNNRVAMVGFSEIPDPPDGPVDGILSTLLFTEAYGDARDYVISMYTDRSTNSTVGLTKADQIVSAASTGWRDGTVHVMVLLTDGQNNNPGSVLVPGNDDYDSNQLCTKFKSVHGALVFTVLVGDHDGDVKKNQIESFLKSCATSSQYFYYAKDATALQEAFEEIIATTHTVRLNQ